MRDLDQLRERGDPTTGRKLGLLAMALVLSVSAVFAMGIMVGRGGETDDAPAIDPLAQLGVPAAKAEARAEPAASARSVDIKPESLSFPSTLAQHDDALVEATVRAAEAEHRALVEPPPVPAALPTPGPAAMPVPVPMPVPTDADLPALTVAGERRGHLEMVARSDRLVAEALPRAAENETAPRGSDGAYTLQVVSYETSDNAERFAKALRARGHKAFVMQADVPGRGRFYRVRAGPFENTKSARDYQQSFEDSERMHTIIVANDAR